MHILPAAAFAVKNRDKIGKVLLTALTVILIPFFLILGSMMELLSAFSGDGVLQSPENIQMEETAVYQSLQAVTEPFYEDVRKQLDAKEKELEASHTTTEVSYDPSGNPVYETKCRALFTKKLNHVSDAYLAAYLTCSGKLDSKTGKIDATAARHFLDRICEISAESSDDINFLIENRFQTLEEMAGIFGDEKTKKKFYASYEAYSEYFTSDEEQINADGWIPDSSTLLSVPLYLQYASPWGSKSYGTGTIKKNGCCPTCLAMVMSYLLQADIYPDDIVSWAGNRYYVNGSGTSWGIFTAAAGYYGVKCTNIGKNEKAMMQALSAGKPVIASMGPGTFTKGGHFIVLTGVTADGNIKVNDPNDSAKKNHIGMEFSAGLILRESKNMWVFE